MVEHPEWHESDPVEQVLHRLVEAAPDPVLVIEAGAPHYLLANAAAERLLGYSQTEFRSIGLDQILDPDNPSLLADLRGRMSAAAIWRGETRVRRKDGTIVPVEATLTCLAVPGRVLCQVLLRDISALKHTQAALARAEARLAEAQRLAHAGSWEWDAETDQVWWSDETYRVFGLNPQDGPQPLDTVLARLHPEDAARTRAALCAAISDGVPFDLHLRLLRPCGEERFIHALGAIQHDAAGCPRRVLGTVQDVTARQVALEVIKHELRVKSALLDSTVEGIFGVDELGRCTFLNRAAAELLGYRPAEIVGQTVHGLIHYAYPDGSPYPAAACPIVAVIRAGKKLRLAEDVLWRRDRTPLPVQYSASPVIDEGRIVGAVVTIANISEQRQARQALERREQELRALVEHAPDIIARFDRTLRLTYLNPAGERTIGKLATDLVGKKFGEAVLPPSVRSAWEITLRQVFRSGRDQTLDITMPTPAGERCYQIRFTPERDLDGGVRSVLSIARDVTDWRRAEEERESLYQAMLEREHRLQETIERILVGQAERRRKEQGASLLQLLTPRERELLRLLAHGRTNEQIGRELGLSRGTVRNQVSRLLPKLGAVDRTQAVAIAVASGLLD